MSMLYIYLYIEKIQSVDIANQNKKQNILH